MSRAASLPSPANDTVVTWAKSHSRNNIINPNLMLRMATDQHWVFHHNTIMLSGYEQYGYTPDSAAIMNCGIPGQQVFGAVSWTVTENLDSPTQTARLEVVNALSVSRTTTTTAPGQTLYQRYHSNIVNTHHLSQTTTGGGNEIALNGNHRIPYYEAVGLGYQFTYKEENLLYRDIADETFDVVSVAGFPDPSVPSDEENNLLTFSNTLGGGSFTTGFYESGSGLGAYFLLVGEEVIRVNRLSGNTFYIPPGGRGVNGVIQQHDPGTTVTLLGFGDPTGRWAGLGYLSVNDAYPYRSMLRPGTCLASYEGYGDFSSSTLTKDNWTQASNRGYEFTGYWFVKDSETTLGEDGLAKLSVDLVSAGYLLQSQKITQSVLQKFNFNSYALLNQEVAAAGINRNIPGDWVDFNSWEPGLPGAYPLQIKTELAQNKAFFDHMNDTNFGTTCEFCQKEYWDYVTNVEHNKQGSDTLGETRAVGKHIYRDSIRVFYDKDGSIFTPGPLFTYGRLMMHLAKTAWEQPVQGNLTVAKWTKIPQTLWENMEDFERGMVWRGQLSFSFDGEKDFNWAKQDYEDTKAYPWLAPLMCPFEATYDNQDWFQPLQDLADMNRMTFTFDRHGYPIFMPTGSNLRGVSYKFNPSSESRGEWWMGWDGSISSYSHNFDTSELFTIVTVSGTSAFGDSTFSVDAAGTGYDKDGNLIWHSSKVGSREALSLTGGLIHTDSVSLDNLILGFSWAQPAASKYGTVYLDRTGNHDPNNPTPTDKLTPLSKKPDVPTHTLDASDPKGNPEDSTRGFQRLYNFLRQRFYIDAAQSGVNYIQQLPVDGKYGQDEAECCKVIEHWLRTLPSSQLGSNGAALQAAIGTSDGVWKKADYNAMQKWFDLNAEALQTDIWWYALGGYDWDFYVAAITGLPIPQNFDKSATTEEGAWIVDQIALRNEVSEWMQKYLKQAVNYGNRLVDDSVRKASVRNISSNFADPRVHLGDVIYLYIPGFLTPSNVFEEKLPPYNNGMYVTQITRTMDLQNNTYTASYSGYRYDGVVDEQFGKLDDNYWIH